MSVRRQRCSSALGWLIGAATLLSLGSLAASAVGQDATPAAGVPNHRIVVRLSDAMLNSSMAKGFARETEVRDVILGTSIYGRASIQAQPCVALQECPDQATFQIVIEGAAHSRSTGYNGPAIIYSRSVTTFRATRQVIFDPGRGFYALVPQVQARTQTFLDGIGSSRGGIVGRIVRRRASRQAAAQHELATEIARQKAERRIAMLFERHTEQRLARLNRIADLRGMAIAALRPAGSGEPNYACCTTPNYLQIATNFTAAEPSIALPGAASAAAAPIEVWVHRSLLGDRLAAAINLLNARPLLAQWPIKIRQVGEWHVVAVDVAVERAGGSLAVRPLPAKQ